MSKREIFQTIVKGVTFVFGTFLLGLTFNVFLKANNFVVGSMSGLSLIFQELLGWNSTIFIYATSIGLLFLSYILLGKEVTSNTVIGSILYPVMVSLTGPMAKIILKHLVIEEYLLIVVLAGAAYGLANGMIYKMGYSTGGGDVVMQILSKYLKVPTAKANVIYSFVIVLASGFVFGWTSFIYAIIILIVSNVVINKIVVGVSDSKVLFICSNMVEELKKMISDEYNSGFTLINTKSSFLHSKKELIMVVVSTRDYHSFKNRILDIDPEAFFIINDCYEVKGGMRKHNIPFL